MAVLFVVHRAEAHGLEHAGDPRVSSPWDMTAVLFLLLMAAAYAVGSARIALRSREHGRLSRAAFWFGWLALMVAVLPAMDAAALARFSAHMAQHELMMLVGPPLVLLGQPLATGLWALPYSWRRELARPLSARAIGWMTTPTLAWALHGLTIWVWHVPALYERAVLSEPAHALQHVMFVGSAMLFWSGVLAGRYGRAGYGAAVFYVFTTAAHTGILGAFFTFAGAPLYRVYDRGGSVDQALKDQQLAGLLMWVAAGGVLAAIGIALFAAWIGEAERRQRASALL